MCCNYILAFWKVWVCQCASKKDRRFSWKLRKKKTFVVCCQDLQIVPVLNVSSEDLPLKTDVTKVLLTLGIQVWPLTEFCPVSFSWIKIIDLPERKINDPSFFSSVPPSNSFVSVSDPWMAFWADTVPFKGPRLASCVASGTTKTQGHMRYAQSSQDTVKNSWCTP